MKLFEMAYRDGKTNKQRYYDTETNKSVIQNITTSGEYYVESQYGPYSNLIDGTKLKKVNGFVYKPDFTTYGTMDACYKTIRDNYWKEHDSLYNMKPRIWYLDIETTAETKIDVVNTPQELVLVQIWDNISKTMIVIGSEPWYYQDRFEIDYKVKYIQVKNEIEIFYMYFNLLREIMPLVILGWNTEGFDYPYMYNRARKLGLDTNLFSISGESSLNEQITSNGQKIYKLKAGGLFYCDMLDYYKKYAFKVQASYALSHIATIELGDTKIDHNEYSNFDGFRTGSGYIKPDKVPEDDYDRMMYYAQERGDAEEIRKIAWGKFVYYGITDTKLVEEIDSKMQATTIALAVASKMGIQFNDVLGTVKPWSQYLANTLYKDNVIMPDVAVNDEEIHIKGGWVMDPVKGKHHWIVSFDFASLYPSIMRAYNMSPETIIPRKDYTDNMRWITKALSNKQTGDEQDEDVFINLPAETLAEIERRAQEDNICVGCNGVFFKKDVQGVIPKLLELLYNERKAFKKEMLNAKNDSHALEEEIKRRGLKIS